MKLLYIKQILLYVQKFTFQFVKTRSTCGYISGGISSMSYKSSGDLLKMYDGKSLGSVTKSGSVVDWMKDKGV